MSGLFLIDLLGNRRGIYDTFRNSIPLFHFNFQFESKNLCVYLFIVLKIFESTYNLRKSIFIIYTTRLAQP